MSERLNNEDGADDNKDTIGEETSHLGAVGVEESAFHFSFVEETLQITDVHDAFDYTLTTDMDKNVDSANGSVSCPHQLSSETPIHIERRTSRNASEFNSVNCLQENKDQNQSNQIDQPPTEDENFYVVNDISESENHIFEMVSNPSVETQESNAIEHLKEQVIDKFCIIQSPTTSKVNTAHLESCETVEDNQHKSLNHSIEELHAESKNASHIPLQYINGELINATKDSVVNVESDLLDDLGCGFTLRSQSPSNDNRISMESDPNVFVVDKYPELNNCVVVSNENIALPLEQSFDEDYTSSDESNIFEDAVDSLITNHDLEKNQNCELDSSCGDKERSLAEVVEPYQEMPCELFSSLKNTMNIYSSNDSFLSSPGLSDYFEHSYLGQEPLVILETEDSRLSNDAESFALSEVHFMQSSQEFADEAVEDRVEINKTEPLENLSKIVNIPLPEVLQSTELDNDPVLSSYSTVMRSEDGLKNEISCMENSKNDVHLESDLLFLTLENKPEFDVGSHSEIVEIKECLSTLNTSSENNDSNEDCVGFINESPLNSLPEKSIENDIYFSKQLSQLECKHMDDIASDILECDHNDDIALEMLQTSITNSEECKTTSFEVVNFDDKTKNLNSSQVESECSKENQNVNVCNEKDNDVNKSFEMSKQNLSVHNNLSQTDMSMTLLYDVKSVVEESHPNNFCNEEHELVRPLSACSGITSHAQSQGFQDHDNPTLSETNLIDQTTPCETNDFISDCDQKSSDAIYLPSLSDSHINSDHSLTDHGLQSFMEITMANVNPALNEQSLILNRTGKKQSITLREEDQDLSETTNLEENYATVKKSDNLAVNFQPEFGYTNENSSHGIMQRSMCDYVTNQSLQLAIPEYNDSSSSDNNGHDQCERQTESVLLMKWPPHFHDQLKTLEEQNIFLSEQLELKKNKEQYFTNLENENKKLAEELENELRNKSEDKLLISSLQHQNNQLNCDIDNLQAVKIDLINVKAENDKLRLSIESISKDKDCELKALCEKIKELQQNLVDANASVQVLQFKNEELLNMSTNVSLKDEHISNLVKDKSNLENSVKALNERISEINELERANRSLSIAIEKEVHKTAEAERLRVILEEQVLNLTSQNEMLWKELKKSTTKEQSLNVMKEEIQEKLVVLNREEQQLEKIKQENKYLSEQLCSKDCTIASLTDDVKKIKSSLVKANVKLNSLESENDHLYEIINELESKIDELNSQTLAYKENINSIKTENMSLQAVLKNEEEQNILLTNERVAMEESATSIGECIFTLMSERDWLSEQAFESGNKIIDLEKENQSLKIHIGDERISLSHIQAQNINLLNEVDCLNNKLVCLTRDLKDQETQCFSLVQENDKLNVQARTLIEAVQSFEEEKEILLTDISSFSEAVTSALMEKETTFDQLSEASTLTEELMIVKELLQSNISDLGLKIQESERSNYFLKIELENANKKDKVIQMHEELIKELELHISSLNEELLSEISKQDFLVINNSELQSQNSMLSKQICDENENKLTVAKLRTELAEQGNAFLDKINSIKDEHQKLKENMNNLRNTNFNLSSLLESKNCETNELVLKVEEFQEQVAKQQLSIASLLSEEEKSKQKDVQINELRDLVKELEVHLSSLNEEFCSELSKHHFLGLANESLKCQLNEEKLSAMATLETISEKISSLEFENFELKKLQDAVLKLTNENQNLTQIQCEADIKLKFVVEEKVELESKFDEKLKLLEGSEEIIRSLQVEKDIQAKDNSHLRQIMVNEINSLTGSSEINVGESSTLVEIYQRLMSEFLNKEREVIAALQNGYEDKKLAVQVEITSLQNALVDKAQEIESLNKELKEHGTIVSELESHLQDVLEQLKNKEEETCDMKRLIMQLEQDKTGLVDQIKGMQHSETELKLEDEVNFLNNEVQCKNTEICDLTNEVVKLKNKENEFAKLLLEEKSIIYQHQETISELKERLDNKDSTISDLTLQLQNKCSEVEQLNNYLETKKKEKEDDERKVEKLTHAADELCQIKKDISNIGSSISLLNEGSDFNKVFLEASQNCSMLNFALKGIFDQWMKLMSEIHGRNTILNSELLRTVNELKMLETQTNVLNEELKAQKVLYDEDVLELKEEVASKGLIISKLSEENNQLTIQSAEIVERMNTVENSVLDVDKFKQEIEHLKAENLKLVEDYSKFNVFKEVNRKLSLEMEELSRSIKFEKQINSELKDKCDLVSHQLAEQKKKNFNLEDKIELLENELQNQNIMKSLRIEFPVGIHDTVEQVEFINQKFTEYEQLKKNVELLIEEHSVLKLEYEKSLEHIKKQEEKTSKILKRELDLKKQIASLNQNEVKTLEKVQTELFSLFPKQPVSFPEIFKKIRLLLEASPIETDELRKKLEEVQQENKALDSECEMMNKQIEAQEKQLALLYKQDLELTNENKELKAKMSSQIHPSNCQLDPDIAQILSVFPVKPESVQNALDAIKTTFSENKDLKNKVAESQEEYNSLDKECEEMFKAYQLKENELVEVLNRETKSAADFKVQEVEMQKKIDSLTEQLDEAKSKKQLLQPEKCQCDELRSRLNELKIDLADRNAKVTALELQFEADNFPIKKKALDLEKSLDQAKHKISELKAEVRRYQEQMHEVTVGLRVDCESCRRNSSTRNEISAQTSPGLVDYRGQLAEKTKEIAILKALCKSRNQRIAELEQNSGKLPRPQRSALKPGKENAHVPLSPSKATKGNL